MTEFLKEAFAEVFEGGAAVPPFSCGAVNEEGEISS
jgi:hypothetical protein